MSSIERLQRLVQAIKEKFHCGAVGLLMIEEESLRLLAADGLSYEALGRRFKIKDHPRLAQILTLKHATKFESDSPLPDPYDGLLENREGEPLLVHDCLGISLYIDNRLWGCLTLDAYLDTFNQDSIANLEKLQDLIQAVVRISLLELDIKSLKQLSWQTNTPLIDKGDQEIIAQSPIMLNLLNELKVVADADLPVLLLGETGVGKDLFAKYIHRHSKRREQPIVYVNCAALPDSLAESELFGHVKGAFSGADAARAGRFETANNGSLFLDEIGELSLPIQAKLLRTLQNGEIQRLGSDKTHKVNTRIIAATNRNLKEYAVQGKFRTDLYHRLSVYPVFIPPLRERGKDILLLAGHFLEFNRTRLGLRAIRLSPETEQALMNYQWPGNVRELEHVISRAAIKMLSAGTARTAIMNIEPDFLDITPAPAVNDSIEGFPQGGPSVKRYGTQIDWASLDDDYSQGNMEVQSTWISKSRHSGEQPANSLVLPLPPGQSLKETLQQVETQMIKSALEQTKNNWSAAARQLGLDASNLHKLAKKHGLKDT